MKKIIFLISIFLISGAIALQGKISGFKFREKVQTRTVQFSIFVGTNYSGKLYKKSKAKVILSVYRLQGNSKDVLWESIVDRGNLRNYPQRNNALFRNLTFYNIPEHSQQIVASYKVVYNTKASEMAYEENCLLSGAKGDTLQISL